MTRDQAELERIFAEHRKKVTVSTIEGDGPTDEDWLNEIKLLSGIKPVPVFVTLLDNRTVQLKIIYSYREQIKLNEVLQSLSKKEGDLNQVALELVAIATANPHITPKFLEENPDLFSNEDIGIIIDTWYTMRSDYNKRIKSFRDERFRKEIRDPVTPVKNDVEGLGHA